MYKYVNFQEFYSELKEYGYSRDACIALFDYFENIEAESDTMLVFDPILIRNQFSEYPDIETAMKDFGFNPESEEDKKFFVEEYLFDADDNYCLVQFN
jgi:hypothetical protein